LRRSYDLMALVGGCYTKSELYARVGTSMNLLGWYCYLQLREEEEQKRLEAMFGTE